MKNEDNIFVFSVIFVIFLLPILLKTTTKPEINKTKQKIRNCDAAYEH